MVTWAIMATKVVVDESGRMNNGKNATKNSSTFGLVKLGYDMNDKKTYYAVKQMKRAEMD